MVYWDTLTASEEEKVNHLMKRIKELKQEETEIRESRQALEQELMSISMSTYLRTKKWNKGKD